MRYLLLIAALVSAISWANPARAGSLVGTDVIGSLTFGSATNFFDPANGYVPAGYGNSGGTTVTISSSQTEFAFNEVFNPDTITADFNATSLVVTDIFGINDGWFNLEMKFTDPAFSGLTLISQNFPNGGLTGSLTGDQIILDWGGGGAGPGTVSASFNIASPAATPLPPVAKAGLVLLAGLAASQFVRRKLRVA